MKEQVTDEEDMRRKDLAQNCQGFYISQTICLFKPSAPPCIMLGRPFFYSITISNILYLRPIREDGLHGCAVERVVIEQGSRQMRGEPFSKGNATKPVMWFWRMEVGVVKVSVQNNEYCSELTLCMKRLNQLA
nr:hypothetical protein [Brevibacillus laterosporus]